MAEPRTWDVPKIDDDVQRVIDGEDILWRRRSGEQGRRQLWETADEPYPEIRLERDLIVEYGPIREVSDASS